MFQKRIYILIEVNALNLYGELTYKPIKKCVSTFWRNNKHFVAF